MKIGICEWSLPVDGPLSFNYAAMAGVDGVQIDLGRAKRDFPMAKRIVQSLYRGYAAMNNIQIPAIAVRELDECPMLSPEGSKARRLAEKAITLAIDAAYSMNIPLVMLPNFDASDIKDESDITKAVKLFRMACDYAQSKHVMLSVENLLGYDEYEKLFALVKRPNMKLYFDTQNYFLNKSIDTPMLLRKLIKHVCQIHFKDGVDNMLSSALLGKGDCKCMESMEVLKEYGYDGWIILENYYDQAPLSLTDENPIELITKDTQTLKEWINK